jgi:ankyrin repeat protein
VRKLALKGADVNFQDHKGRTALHHGLEKEFDPALLEWLVERGASPDVEDHSGVTARLKASRKKDKGFATYSTERYSCRSATTGSTFAARQAGM